MSLYVDTSIWYAAADRQDAYNARAKSILSCDEALVTSNHVLVETWTLIHHRLGSRAAEMFWDGLRSGVATIEVVGHADLESAWDIARAFRDQDFSIVDRTSFALMLRLGLHRAASFDDDFAVFRFGPNRRKSFTVVR